MNILSHLMIPADIRNFPEPRILYKNLCIKVLLVIGLPITVLYSIYHFHFKTRLMLIFGIVSVIALIIAVLLPNLNCIIRTARLFGEKYPHPSYWMRKAILLVS